MFLSPHATGLRRRKRRKLLLTVESLEIRAMLSNVQSTPILMTAELARSGKLVPREVASAESASAELASAEVAAAVRVVRPNGDCPGVAQQLCVPTEPDVPAEKPALTKLRLRRNFDLRRALANRSSTTSPTVDYAQFRAAELSQRDWLTLR